MPISGVVSICEGGKVAYKIVCDRWLSTRHPQTFAWRLKEHILDSKTVPGNELSLREIYCYALRFVDSGAKPVVMSATGEDNGESGELGAVYRETFHRTAFYPMAENGISDVLAIISLDDCVLNDFAPRAITGHQDWWQSMLAKKDAREARIATELRDRIPANLRDILTRELVIEKLLQKGSVTITITTHQGIRYGKLVEDLAALETYFGPLKIAWEGVVQIMTQRLDDEGTLNIRFDAI